MPDRIGSEWARDPIFLADQSELNLTIDEAQSNQAIRGTALENLQNARPAYWTNFDRRLEQVAQVNIARRPGLIQEINQALAVRTRTMMAQLTHTAENLQLLEVEAYETLGDKLVAENNPNAKDVLLHVQIAKSWIQQRFGTGAGSLVESPVVATTTAKFGMTRLVISTQKLRILVNRILPSRPLVLISSHHAMVHSLSRQEEGPFSPDEFRQRLANLTSHDQVFVWRTGMDAWKKVQDVPEIGLIEAQAPTTKPAG